MLDCRSPVINQKRGLSDHEMYQVGKALNQLPMLWTNYCSHCLHACKSAIVQGSLVSMEITALAQYSVLPKIAHQKVAKVIKIN